MLSPSKFGKLPYRRHCSYKPCRHIRQVDANDFPNNARNEDLVYCLDNRCNGHRCQSSDTFRDRNSTGWRDYCNCKLKKSILESGNQRKINSLTFAFIRVFRRRRFPWPIIEKRHTLFAILAESIVFAATYESFSRSLSRALDAFARMSVTFAPRKFKVRHSSSQC